MRTSYLATSIFHVTYPVRRMSYSYSTGDDGCTPRTVRMTMDQCHKGRVGIATPLCCTVRDSNLGGGKRCYLLHTHPDQSWDPPSLLSNGRCGFSRGCVVLSTHSYLAQRLRMSTATPLFPLCASCNMLGVDLDPL